MEFVWEKPVLIFYKERLNRETKAFAVIKAKKLTISNVDEDVKFRGDIKDFFPLMGDIDYISSDKGKSDRYVVCWFDDKENNFNKSWRRLLGVTFPEGINFTTDDKGKKTYNAKFKAKYGKINGG